MSHDQPQINPSVLLENREYLRKLARSLVFDEHRADDLVQQACLALLERPPRRSGSLRSWMASVVQNLAYSMLARESERSWRENLAAKTSSSEGDESAEERAFDQQQALLDAVRKLRQPYRSAIFLRYYKDLSPTHIAAQEKLSLATVKTRLRRGLELLRAELDASHGGQRGNWCLALLPMAAPLCLWKFAGASGAAAYIKGILLMKKPIVAVVSALALAGVATLTWVAMDDRASEQPENAARSTGLSALEDGALGKTDQESLLPAGVESPDAKRVNRAEVSSKTPELAKAKGPDHKLTGRVVDELGAPVALAEVRLYGGLGAGLEFATMGALTELRGGTAGVSTSTDAKGRFSLDLQSTGSMSLAVGADFYAPFRKVIMAEPEASIDVGDLKLDTGCVLSGRVVDASGVGIAGADIDSLGPKNGPQVLYFGAMSLSSQVALTDGDGYFSIKRHAVGPWRLRASSAEHPSAEESGQTLRAGDRSEGIRISLENGFQISGSVVGLPSPMPEDLTVVASVYGESGDIFVNGTGFGSQRSALRSNGEFRLRGLRSGQDYRLRLMLGSQVFGGKRRSEDLIASPGDSGARLVYSTPAALLFRVVDSETGEAIENFDLSAGGFAVGSQERGLRLPGSSSNHPDGRIRLDDFQAGMGMLAQDGPMTVKAVGYEDFVLGKLKLTPGQEVDLGLIRMNPVPVVRVTVRDVLTREPVVGAMVSMSPEKEAPIQRGGPQRMSFSVDVTGGDQSIAFSDGTEDGSLRGVTNENGVCVLTSMSGQSVRIRVDGEEHAPYASDLLTLPIGADVEHAAELELGSTVRISVVDAEGNPLSGLSVEHRSPDAGAQANPMAMLMAVQRGGQHTDSEGNLFFENLNSGSHSFSLQEDPFAGGFGGMRIMGGGETSAAPKWTELDVQPGAKLSLTLVAAPRGLVAGVVREGGNTLAGARVKLLPEDSSAGRMSMMGLPGMGRGGPVATTDSKGRYELEAVPVGDYRLEITHPTRQMPSVLEASLREGINELNVALSVALIEGRITDPEGKPLAGLKVSVAESREGQGASGGMRMVAIMVDSGGSSMTITDGSGRQEVATDADGYYQLRGVAIDKPLVVEASGAAFAAVKSEPVELRAGETLGGVNLQLRAAGNVDLVIRASDGQPAGGFLVTATYLGSVEPAPEPMTAFIGPDGKGRVSGLLVGEWEVALRPMGMPGGGGSAAAPEPRMVKVLAGENHQLDFQVE